MTAALYVVGMMAVILATSAEPLDLIQELCISCAQSIYMASPKRQLRKANYASALESRPGDPQPRASQVTDGRNPRRASRHFKKHRAARAINQALH
jgi:hypothetical protein